MGTTKKIISVALSITTAVWLSGAAMVAPVQAATTVELQAQSRVFQRIDHHCRAFEIVLAGCFLEGDIDLFGKS